jgi:hypothetical protein
VDEVLEVGGALAQPSPYDPDDWQFETDSARLDVGYGPHKYQGIPLGQVLQTMQPQAEASTVVLHTEGEPVLVPLADVLGDDDLRIFTVLSGEEVAFAVARLDGQVVAPRVTRVEVQ